MYKKKSLGQHFLYEKNMAGKIVSSLQLAGIEYETIIEVGPGEGILTDFLINKPIDLFLVEIDADLIPLLQLKYPNLNDRIIHEDFLKLDFSRFKEDSIGLIGNFPYNISSQILIKVIENRDKVPEVVGMFQKELAERIISNPGSKTYGRISVLVQTFYKTEKLFPVPKQVFNPPPQVESMVIRLNRKNNFVLPCNENLYFEVIRQAFGQRRKTLRNALSIYKNRFIGVDVDLLNKRAEMLSTNDFIFLTQKIEGL